jgi:hypothetical protein
LYGNTSTPQPAILIRGAFARGDHICYSCFICCFKSGIDVLFHRENARLATGLNPDPAARNSLSLMALAITSKPAVARTRIRTRQRTTRGGQNGSGTG